MRRYTILSLVIGFALAVAGLFVPLLASAGHAAAPDAPVGYAPGEPAFNITYTVNVTNGTGTAAGCISPGSCSLPGAVEAANASGATYKTIVFAPALNKKFISLVSTLYITGGGISIQGSGRETTTIYAPYNQLAIQIASSNNNISDLQIAGDYTGNGDGVRLVTGTSNSLNRLTIREMGGNGIWILSASSHNNLAGNYIGLFTYNGVFDTFCSFGNLGDGILVSGGSNLIAGNIIGCNHLDGIHLNGPGAQNNSVVLNEIGVVPNARPVPNSGNGVHIENGATNNQIGIGNALGMNVIAGNLATGINIAGGSTSGNTVRNNLIGLSPTGTFAIGNILSGVQIEDSAHDNIIGGRVLTEANTIAGNGGSGVFILGIGAYNGSDTHGNQVVGNRIGLNAAGTLTVPNGYNGVSVSYGANQNMVGMDDDAYRNTISGNGKAGVGLVGVRANTVAGNYLTNNHTLGVLIENASLNTLFNNNIHANGAAGISISGTLASTNTLQGNAVWNHQAWGIVMWIGAHANTVTGQHVYSNGAGIVLAYTGTVGNLVTNSELYANLVGIGETSGASGNVWSHLSSYNHAALAIDKDPTAQTSGPFPAIISATVNGGLVTVYGKASPAVLQSVKVELYRAATNASGYGDGKTYLGEDMADSNGNWSVTFNGANGCFTAFQTVKGFLQVYPSSSEFGLNSCRTMLPVVVR